MSCFLRKRPNKDGTTSLRLEIYYNGKRTYETLKHLKLAKPSNPLDREHNKVLLRQAESIRVARAAELDANNYNLTSNGGKKVIVIDWIQNYIDNYSKSDKRNIQGALNRFKNFLLKEKISNLTFGNITPLLIENFIDYLEENSTGEGAISYYNRFKKVILSAYYRKILKDNVFDFVKKKVKGKAKEKDILTLAEMQFLSTTPIQNLEVKNAFLFSCLTGLRWNDIKALKWADFNPETQKIRIIQHKTKEALSINLNETALQIISNLEKKDEFIFQLPTANGANKTLKAWIKRAKINKHITWHNARHSFGTNLIFLETDIYHTSKLMGHTSVKHTQRYLKASEDLRQKATEKLNFTLG
jgi:integrase